MLKFSNIKDLISKTDLVEDEKKFKRYNYIN